MWYSEITKKKKFIKNKNGNVKGEKIMGNTLNTDKENIKHREKNGEIPTIEPIQKEKRSKTMKKMKAGCDKITSEMIKYEENINKINDAYNIVFSVFC